MCQDCGCGDPELVPVAVHERILHHSLHDPHLLPVSARTGVGMAASITWLDKLRTTSLQLEGHSRAATVASHS